MDLKKYLNIHSIKENYIELGKIKGCDTTIVVEARDNEQEESPHAVLYVGTNPFKPINDIIGDIQETLDKLHNFAHLHNYQIKVLDFDTFDTLTTIGSVTV